VTALEGYPACSTEHYNSTADGETYEVSMSYRQKTDAIHYVGDKNVKLKLSFML
jgi:hypothetical protein